MGEIDTNDITNATVTDFAEKMSNSYLARKSIKDIMIVVKMILAFGMESDIIPYFVVRKINYPSKNLDKNKKIVVYDHAEQRKIIEYTMNNPSSRNLSIALVLCTGMRIGEICGLQWNCIDLEHKLIHIRQTIQRISIRNEDYKWHSKVIIDTPKTIDSNRDVPIPSSLLPMIKNFGKIVKPHYYFVSSSDLPIEPRVFRDYYNNLIKEKVQLSRCLKFHGLRHTFATKMVESGIDLKTISSILGHSDVAITMNLYVHPTEANKASSINKAFKNIF